MHWQRKYGSPIKKISDKQQTVLDRYKVKRKKFLEHHRYCMAQLKGCTRKATEIHHMKGKNSTADWLDESTFLPVCRCCHNQIEEGGSWVYEKGFKIKRV